MKNKVLLIDDSITIHRVIDLSINSDKYDIVKVFSQEAAEPILKDDTFDFILLDNKLANTDIITFISTIKHLQPKAKIILLVGAFDKFNLSDLKNFGADDYIVKPFDSGSLNSKLNLTPRTSSSNTTPTPDNSDSINKTPEIQSSVENNKNLIEDHIDNSFIQNIANADIEREETKMTEEPPKPVNPDSLFHDPGENPSKTDTKEKNTDKIQRHRDPFQDDEPKTVKEPSFDPEAQFKDLSPKKKDSAFTDDNNRSNADTFGIPVLGHLQQAKKEGMLENDDFVAEKTFNYDNDKDEPVMAQESSPFDRYDKPVNDNPKDTSKKNDDNDNNENEMDFSRSDIFTQFNTENEEKDKDLNILDPIEVNQEARKSENENRYLNHPTNNVTENIASTRKEKEETPTSAPNQEITPKMAPEEEINENTIDSAMMSSNKTLEEDLFSTNDNKDSETSHINNSKSINEPQKSKTIKEDVTLQNNENTSQENLSQLDDEDIFAKKPAKQIFEEEILSLDSPEKDKNTEETTTIPDIKTNKAEEHEKDHTDSTDQIKAGEENSTQKEISQEQKSNSDFFNPDILDDIICGREKEEKPLGQKFEEEILSMEDPKKEEKKSDPIQETFEKEVLSLDSPEKNDTNKAEDTTKVNETIKTNDITNVNETIKTNNISNVNNIVKTPETNQLKETADINKIQTPAEELSPFNETLTNTMEIQETPIDKFQSEEYFEEDPMAKEFAEEIFPKEEETPEITQEPDNDDFIIKTENPTNDLPTFDLSEGIHDENLLEHTIPDNASFDTFNEDIADKADKAENKQELPKENPAAQASNDPFADADLNLDQLLNMDFDEPVMNIPKEENSSKKSNEEFKEHLKDEKISTPVEKDEETKSFEIPGIDLDDDLFNFLDKNDINDKKIEVKEENKRENIEHTETDPEVVEFEMTPAEHTPEGKENIFSGITITIGKDEIMNMVGSAMDKKFLEKAVQEVLAQNMKEIIRNIVPAIAEKYIKEEIEKLKEDNGDQ